MDGEGSKEAKERVCIKRFRRDLEQRLGEVSLGESLGRLKRDYEENSDGPGVACIDLLQSDYQKRRSGVTLKEAFDFWNENYKGNFETLHKKHPDANALVLYEMLMYS